MTANLIIALLTAHVISEGYMRLKSIWFRGGVYGGLCALVLMLFSYHGFGVQGHNGYGLLASLLFALGLGGLRTLIRYIGVKHVSSQPNLKALLLSQSILVLSLIGTALFLTSIDFATVTSVLIKAFNLNHSVIFLGYALILKPSSLLIERILKRYTLNDALSEHDGLKSGGELIGYLERILILTFSLQGEYAVIGFILTAKSIFRFGELNQSQNRRLTEYVLLGSLLSVTITSVIALLLKYLQ